jgi:hypothetical protein
MHFDVSPKIVFEDVDLEFEIMRRIQAQNADIMASTGWMLPVGSNVVLFNEVGGLGKRRAQVRPRLYTITAHRGSMFEIRGEGQPRTFLVSRRQIRPFDN